MRLLWTAGDRMILFGIRPEEIAGNEWIVFDCQTSAKGRPAALPGCNLPGSPAGRKFIVCRSQTLR